MRTTDNDDLNPKYEEGDEYEKINTIRNVIQPPAPVDSHLSIYNRTTSNSALLQQSKISKKKGE